MRSSSPNRATLAALLRAWSTSALPKSRSQLGGLAPFGPHPLQYRWPRRLATSARRPARLARKARLTLVLRAQPRLCHAATIGWSG